MSKLAENKLDWGLSTLKNWTLAGQGLHLTKVVLVDGENTVVGTPLVSELLLLELLKNARKQKESIYLQYTNLKKVANKVVNLASCINAINAYF